MTAPVPPSFDEVLRLCASADPGPWYPSRYAGDRDSLDEPLNLLRLAGLVRLTAWEQGIGQGYELTAAGRAALDNPRAAARLREGRLPTPRPAPAARRRSRAASEVGSLLTVTNVAVAAMVVTF